MLIHCTHCQRQFNLPDEKIPPRAFALNCPGCQGRIEVDPTQASKEEPAPPPVAKPAGEAVASTAAPPAAGSTPSADLDFEPLAPVRGQDQQLLDHLYPLAAVVDLTSGPTSHLVSGLERLGMRDVEVFNRLDEATTMMGESDLSVLLIVLDRATAPPCEALEALYKVPLPIRRGTFVALMASNVKSLDGQTAFYLQVNCLLSSREPARFPALLQRALVFHLRHYRHWDVQQDEA